MELIVAVLLFILGVALIVKGGDIFVDAAAWIARISGIPKLIVGATIVSVATTLPEMFVSALAAAQGKVDMSIGNAIGSVTANIGLIMAISLIFMPSKIRRRDYVFKSIMMLAAAAIVVVGGLSGSVSFPLCCLLIAIFVAFIIENLHSAKHSHDNAEADDNGDDNKDKKTVISNILKFVFGAAGIVLGANLLVDNGTIIAKALGVDDRIIGVTIVAIGTSLPELVTTVTAIVKKQSSLSVGNIIGANILDTTLILPISALISGKSLPVSQTSAQLDLPACLIVGGIAVIPTLISGKFRRWQGFALLAVYAVYVFLTCTAAA